MRDGNFAVGVATVNQDGEKVSEGTAEVAQPPTVYAFTGQGSQEQGMEVDFFSIVEIARTPRKRRSILVVSWVRLSAIAIWE